MSSQPDRDAVLNALRAVVDPDIRRDIVTLGFVKDLTCLLYTSPSPRDS